MAKNPENKTEFENMPANYGLIELLGISIKEGRSFSKNFADSSVSSLTKGIKLWATIPWKG
ncbi:MAG: hypothetical protein IPN68_04140 [Bacteroidetes bacterium]|nr:hypothetical protein [Bacteroidota bacterium]